MERADAVVGFWSVHLLEIAPKLTDAHVVKLQDDDEVLGPIKSILSQGYSPTWTIFVPCPWKAENVGLCGRPSFCRTRFWFDGMAMPSSLWCHSLCAASCSLILMPAHSQTIWAPKECWRSYAAFTTDPACVKNIDAWCRQCEGCAISRGPPSRPHGHLRKVSAGAPINLVAIDILSGLPATADGYKYLLVATDYFTKRLEPIPLCDAEAPTCMRALTAPSSGASACLASYIAIREQS